MSAPRARAERALYEIYPRQTAEATARRMWRLTGTYARGGASGGLQEASIGAGRARLTERDAMLITYPDQVQRPGERPLATLGAFLEETAAGLVTMVHVLPFFPSSSDDGFAVVNYGSVDPAYGDWGDVTRLGERFRLMFDAVINHVSSESDWFRRFLAGEPGYQDRFLTIEAGTDLAQVVRPRALPLGTAFMTADGPKTVWTTFSADQVDLDYRDPDVLLDVLDVVLGYAARGASLLRLDAVAYLWKERGTPCIHLPQTHALVRLFRAVLDEVAPQVLLVTETNVAHRENVSYFGNGHDEAQLVYNFALPPLVLHALRTGSGRALSAWAAGMVEPSEEATFLNFLASHDGVGLNAARAALDADELDALVAGVTAQGGLVSYRRGAEGRDEPYELNVNYLDALSPRGPGEHAHLAVARFAVAHAIAFSLVGVPAVYIHSLLGSRGWPAGVAATGSARSVNRQKLAYQAVMGELADGASERHRVHAALARLLGARASCPAFDPYGRQQVIDAGDDVFALLRSDRSGAHRAVCVHNLTARHVSLERATLEVGREPGFDLVSGCPFAADGRGQALTLEPYQAIWLVPQVPMAGSLPMQ